MAGWIGLGLLAALALYAIILFNGLVKARQMVNEGWSGISVQLKRRADLVPQLVEVVKGYAGHERDTLERVVRLRNEAQRTGEEHPAARGHAEAALGQALGRLFALAENYPDLKASENFLDFQNALEEVENQIQFARRYYNGAVRQLNVMIEQFPSNLVANAFGFGKREYFELESPQEAAVPQVSLKGDAP